MSYTEPTDVLRRQHLAIKSELRRLEHSLGLLLGAVDRGHASLERSLETARVAGAVLGELIPAHEEQEEFVLSRLLGTPASVQATQAIGEHSEMESAYEAFLDGLDELDRAAPAPERVRGLAMAVHELSDRLGAHMRREEEYLYPKAEAALDEDEKRAILAHLRVSAGRMVAHQEVAGR